MLELGCVTEKNPPATPPAKKPSEERRDGTSATVTAIPISADFAPPVFGIHVAPDCDYEENDRHQEVRQDSLEYREQVTEGKKLQ